jgi:hypothetical protein
MNTDIYIGCAIVNADSVSMDINDNDNQTVGCANARAARADFSSNSDSGDISDDDSSCAEMCYPVRLKSDCGGQGSVLLVNATEKRIIHQPLQKHAMIYFVFLISQNSEILDL